MFGNERTNFRQRMWLRTALLFVAVLFWSACSNQSCSCSGFEQAPYPDTKYNQTIPSSGTVRVTSSGLNFVEDNLGSIVNSTAGGLNFCVPKTDAQVDICHKTTCMSGEDGCDMELTIDSADITTSPPDTLDVNVTIGSLDETLDIRIAGEDCTLTLHKDGDQSQPGTLTGKVPVTFTVDSGSPTKDVKINVGDISANFDDIDFDIDGTGGIGNFLVCEGTDLGTEIQFLRNFLYSMLENQVNDMAGGAIEEFTCRTCDMQNPCTAGTTCEEGICRYGNGECAARPLGVEGKLLLGELLSDYTEHPEAFVSLMAKVADHAEVDTGVTLGLRSGYTPDAFKRCIPVDPTARPDFASPGISQTVASDTTPNGDPFMFGLGYHKKGVEHLLWSTWASGATCLLVGTETIDLISTSALGIFLPSIKDLSYGKNSQVYLKIVPQTPPKVQLGANQVSPNGSSYTIDEPLMTVDWKDLDIHLYSYAQDRWTRLFTLRSDLLLPIAITPDGMGQIIPVLGDFEDALKNIRPMNTELLKEDPQKIVDLIPTLVGFALPSLAGSISQPIEVPEFAGFELELTQDSITSVDNNTVIAIFANLAIANTMPFTAPLDTVITGEPEIDYGERTPSGIIRPSVTIPVAAFNTELALEGTTEIEYSYRVDNGLWSLYDRRNELVIDDPVLVLPGEHTVEVRARYRGVPSSVDREPATIDVMVDYESPTVAIERSTRDILEFAAKDVVVPSDQLRYRYRIVDGETPSEWSPWTNESNLNLANRDLPDVVRVDVEVMDKAGNVGRDSQSVTVRKPLESVTPTAGNEGTAGCNSTGSNPTNLAVLLLFGLFLVWRRRRREDGRTTKLVPAVIALAAVMSISSCSCDEDTASGQCAEECTGGTVCVDGECVMPEPECQSIDDCADGEICQENQCIENTCEATCDEECGEGKFGVCDDSGACTCQTYCPDGCGDSEYCCHDSNSCESLPDPCSEQVCEPGYEPSATSDATADNATCEVTPGTCECEPLPPIPIGWYGHYASIDRNAGVTAIATYNSTYEDLMVGLVDGSLEVDWYWVDGVPAMADVEGDPNGPRGGIKDKGDDVGRYSSLAIADDGSIHVLYRDDENATLKYGRSEQSSGDLAFETVELDAEGDTGYWTDLVVDGTDIHAVWTADHWQNTNMEWKSQLRYASFATDADLGSLSVSPEVLDEKTAPHPCGEDCDSSRESCFASTGQCVEPTDDCSTMCDSGFECLNGTCEEIHASLPQGFSKITGLFNELTLTSDGLLLVYYDGEQESTAWMRRSSGEWGMTNLLGQPSGPYASAMEDANGDVHIAYMDTSNNPALVYENLTSGTSAEVVMEGLRDTVDGWLLNDIGEDVSLRAEDDGTVTLTFQDASRHELYTATRDASGSWTVDKVSEPGDPYTGGHGFYSSLLQIPGESLIVEMVINQQVDPTEGHTEFYAP